MFKREVKLRPAYDKRDSDPSKNYGIHGVDLCMYLKGERGVVQFIVYTGWHLEHVQDELIERAYLTRDVLDLEMLVKPMPADLGFHSYTQLHNYNLYTPECSLLDGHECYYEGSSLAAYRIYDVLVEKGSDGVWSELEAYYEDVFNAKR